MISAKNPHADKAQYGTSERHIFGGGALTMRLPFPGGPQKKETDDKTFFFTFNRLSQPSNHLIADWSD